MKNINLTPWKKVNQWMDSHEKPLIVVMSVLAGIVIYLVWRTS